jgi:hypothetical protein
MAKYNGWTNYETWKANLELFSNWTPTDFDDEILECWNGKKWDKDDLETVADQLANNLEETVEDLYSDIEDPFLESLFNNFVSEVNFNEIAENMIDDYKDSLI